MRICRIRPIPNSPMIMHILNVRLIIKASKRDIQMSRRLWTWLDGGGWGFKNGGGDDGRSRPLDPKEISLIKLSTLCNDRLLGSRIVKLPALVVRGVANEDAFLHVRPKAPPLSLVLLDVDIGNTPPDTKHGYIWFYTKEGLPGCFARHSRGGSPVPDMDEGSKGFTPERQG